jgi:hypothetical protein
VAKDKMGNELQVGDLVEFTLPENRAIGKVTVIEPGGRITGVGKNGIRYKAERVKVLFDYDVLYQDPNVAQSEILLKVHDPGGIADAIGATSIPSKLVTN